MAKKRNLLPWFSGKGEERRFLQIGNKFFQHPKYRGLSASSRITYLAMGIEAGGKAEFEFSHGMAKKHGVSESTFDRAVKELISAGFIVRLPNTKMDRFAKARFKFSTAWKIDSS